MTRDRWREIRALIEQDIMDGVMEPGARLPTEPELVQLYGVGRHTVRRAVTELAKAGYLSVEQGVAPLCRPARGSTMPSADARACAATSTPRALRFRGRRWDLTGSPRPRVLPACWDWPRGPRSWPRAGGPWPDGVPVNIGLIYHDASRFADFATRRRAMGSTTAVYQSYGITDYLRGQTQIHARPARGEEPRQLHQHADMPVLVVRAVDTLLDGTPIAHSEVIWSAARVKFSINLDEDEDDPKPRHRAGP